MSAATECGTICQEKGCLINFFIQFHLFREVLGRPGFVVSRSLLLLGPLPLLQPVFVPRGLVYVPILQGLGDVLPQTPAKTTSKQESGEFCSGASWPAGGAKRPRWV